MNIIGDIAGNYNTLMALLKKMPDDEPFSVGDMIDRGPRSKEVLEFFKKNGKAVLGNHEHMMLVYFRMIVNHTYPGSTCWLGNDAGPTLKSFGIKGDLIPAEELLICLNWLSKLPLFYQEDGLFISHAAFNANLGMEKWLDPIGGDRGVLWYRGCPGRIEGKFHVYGHDYDGGLFSEDEDGKYALCIDDSWHRQLMGVHWPSMEIYTQEYID